MHKNELFFRPSVFGYPARPPLSLPPPLYPPRGRSIGDPCLKLYFNFCIIHSNPGTQDGIQWLKFNRRDNKIIAPYYNIQNWSNNIVYNFKYDLKNNECDNYWNKYLV